MQQRRIGSFTTSAIGLGCMNLSHAYGTPPSDEAAGALLLRALAREPNGDLWIATAEGLKHLEAARMVIGLGQ